MHTHIFIVVLCVQSLLSCQQGIEKNLPLAADIALQSAVSGQQSPETIQSPTANIIFQSADGGQTWQDISAGLPQNFQTWCIFADNGKVFLGTETGLYHNDNPLKVQTWRKEVFLGGRITDVFPGLHGPFSNSAGRGLFKEILNTGMWRMMDNNLENPLVSTVLETPDGAIFVGCDSGIFKTADGGRTWKQVFEEGIVRHLVATDGVLIGCGLQGLLRSTDGGEHWDWVFTEDGMAIKAGVVEGGFVAVTAGVNTNKNVKANGRLNKLHLSADGGKTWQRIDKPLLSSRDYDLGLTGGIYDIEQAGEYLFCSLDAGIFRSADRGKTWELVRASANNKVFEIAVSGQTIYIVEVSVGC